MLTSNIICLDWIHQDSNHYLNMPLCDDVVTSNPNFRDALEKVCNKATGNRYSVSVDDINLPELLDDMEINLPLITNCNPFMPKTILGKLVRWMTGKGHITGCYIFEVTVTGNTLLNFKNVYDGKTYFGYPNVKAFLSDNSYDFNASSVYYDLGTLTGYLLSTAWVRSENKSATGLFIYNIYN